MERKRCERFHSLTSEWDREIADEQYKAENLQDGRMRNRAATAVTDNKRAKAHSLETHLSRCPACT
jgi:hypothetical protein